MNFGVTFRAVEIEINGNCNQRCSYCPNSISRRDHLGVMEPKLFDKILSQLEAIGFNGRISYSFFNEPLLHPDFVNVVHQTRARLPDADIDIYTNGSLLTESVYKALRENGASRFTVTRHKGGAKEYVFEEIYAALSPEERKRVKYQNTKDLHLTNRGGVLPKLAPAAPKDSPCFIPSSIVTITVEGNVLACFEDFGEKLVMGNLNTESLIHIWNSEKYVNLRKNLALGCREKFMPCSLCSRTEVLFHGRKELE